jgi:hypothetical protein
MTLSQMQERMSETVARDDFESNGGDVTKLVPVVESMPYQERAQSAEKKAQLLADQLAEANQKVAQISQKLESLQVEQRLTHKLVAAGVSDLEAAVLMARARMHGEGEADVDGCVEQLKEEKRYLFGGSQETVTSRKTASAKDRVTHSQTVLERAAKKAARTGNRADLQEYLKLRRNLL